MAKFVVYSGIPRGQMDVMTCARGIPEVLKEAGIKEVKIRRCYCCVPPEMRKVVMEFEAPSKESLSKALAKIEFPVESIMEVSEVTPKQ